MDAVAFGTKARADKLTAHVRAMHRTVSGELPEAAGPFPSGTPYRADDPKLLLWILAGAGGVGDARLRQVRPLALGRRAERALGRLPRRRAPFGLRERDMPRDIDGFRAYMADMYASGELFVTPAAARRWRSTS